MGLFWKMFLGMYVAFLIAYFATGRDLAQATWGLVIGSGVAIVVGLVVERRIAPFPLIAGGAGLLFGGLSLFFDDPRILKIKPTIMNGVFAALLLGGMAIGKNPLKLMLGEAFSMPPEVWRKLTFHFAGLFVGLAVLNEIVWRTQPEATWVLFRFPGLMVITLVFSLAHTPILMKYIKAEELPPPPTE